MVDKVECRVLGPVAVEVNGEPVRLNRQQVRHLLAVLLLDVGRSVSIGRLVDLLWPDDPPGDTRAALLATVSRLRAALTTVPGIEVVRRGVGYAVDTDPEVVDAYRFRRLVETAARTSDAATRSALAGEAMSLWRGPALADVGTEATRNATCAGLYRTREQALDLRIRAELELGRHVGLVAELTDLVAADPLNEQAVSHLVVALYRSGRRAEALAACQQAKAVLAEQLGLDPGAILQRLELAVLRADPVLDVVPPPATADGGDEARPITGLPPTATTGPVPAQLPADSAVFVGRARQLAALDVSVGTDPLARRAARVTIVAIVGPAGAGKTALALHWAHRSKDRFPDGQLYVDLRGHAEAPPLRPVEALTRLLYGLGVPATEIPVEVDAAAGQFRSLLATRRILLLLDNAGTAEQVRPLLPGGGTSVAVVTSRERLSGLVALDGACRIGVDALRPEESLVLLSQIVGGDRIDAEREAATQLADVCGHLPLALRIAAANVAGRPGTSVADFVTELHTRHRLSGLQVPGDPQASVRSAFELSYRAHSARTRRLFRLLSLLPGADFDTDAAVALAGTTVSAVHHDMADLVRTHLVTDLDNGRYTQHDLLRLFGRERIDEEETTADGSAAVRRLLTYFLDRCDAAAALAYPQMLRLPRRSEPSPAPFTDAPAAVAWLEAERANVVAAIRCAAAIAGAQEMAWRLADALRGYFFSRRYTVDWLLSGDAALTAAQSAGDDLGLAAAHLNLATAHRSQSRTPAAVDSYTAALRHSRRGGWREGASSALGGLAMVYCDIGQLARAADLLGQALEVTRELGLVATEAVHLGNRGVVRLWLGDLAGAMTDFNEALVRYRASGSLSGEALMHTDLGWTYHYLGEPERAAEAFTAGLALHREVGDRYGEILACTGLAELHAMTGNGSDAVGRAATAHELAAATGDSGSQALALTALANAHRAAAQPQRAADYAAQAVHLAGEAQHRGLLTEAHLALAHAHYDLRRDEPATTHAEKAYAIARHDGYQILEARALTLLADIHQGQCCT